MLPKLINNLDKVSNLKQIGITNFRVELLDENNSEIDKILKCF